MLPHVVQTRHIQRLIENGLSLAIQVNNRDAGSHIGLSQLHHRGDPGALGPSVDQVLGKAAADLRHAAEELEAERLSCFGWVQQ